MDPIIASVASMGVLGVSVGLGLAYASAKLAVYVDPIEEKLREVLPGINCGACGYPGCTSYAEAVVKDGVKTNLCIPGGAQVAVEIALALGVAPEAAQKLTARVLCQGGHAESTDKFEYQGVENCHALGMVAGGDKPCPYGCLGHGSCAQVCPFDALFMNDNGLPVVRVDKCTGCGICVQECPRNIITVTETDNSVDIRCRSLDKGGVTKKYCVVGCIGCARCEKSCPYDAIERSEEHTSELQSHSFISYAVFCLKKKKQKTKNKKRKNKKKKKKSQ